MKLTKITTGEKQQYSSLSLEEKISLSKTIIHQVLSKLDLSKVAVAWTGGKDSTLLLWLIRETCKDHKLELPQCVFIDEGDVFEEIWDFTKKLEKEWQLKVSITHNKDVSSKADKLGDEITVENLNKRNQSELKRLGYTKKSFPYKPESFVGNHLMKTVATNIWLEKHQISHLFVGVRWDEQGARAEDDFLREIETPQHYRVEPILHISERDVWDIIKKHGIPYVDLYEKGYRSLGAKTTTGKVSDTPAWKQDIENTTERAGRQQDKEKVMERLRKLGYM